MSEQKLMKWTLKEQHKASMKQTVGSLKSQDRQTLRQTNKKKEGKDPY
jgi:hypothetical protein